LIVSGPPGLGACDRRRFGIAVGLGALLLGAPALAASGAADWQEQFAAIEARAGGALGAFVLDTGSGKSLGWRADEHFAMCSSFKLSLAALVYSLADGGTLSLDEPMAIARADVMENSPITDPHVGRTMMIGELAHAAQLFSDNTAANLLLKRVGGPARLTAFWRSLGDDVSRLDHFEPELNHVPAGAVADTTTPRAMAHTLAKMLLGDVLKPATRERLLAGMAETRTGLDRIRAGLPQGWWAGDKTGTGYSHDYPGQAVDLAITRPPARAPLIITGFVRSPPPRDDVDPAALVALADVGRLAARWAMAS
jgi:beta-lactamase class A